MTNEIDLAYIAGFLDGEGSVYRQKTHGGKYSYPKIAIYNTNREVLLWIKLVLGCGSLGNHSKLGSFAGSVKPCYEWRVSGSKAVVILRDLFPYLRVKKAKVEVLL